jgi:AraC-like DNA-binding protein
MRPLEERASPLYSRDLYARGREMLDHAPMLRSRSFEETRAYLKASHDIDMELVGRPGYDTSVDVRLNALFLPAQWVAYLNYGAAARLRLSPDSSPWLTRDTERKRLPAVYWVHFSLQGSLQAVIRGQAFDGDEHRGIVLSPAGDKILHTSANNARLSLAVREEALNRHLAALLGFMPREPLEFAPAVGAATGHGRRLAGMLHWAAAESERGALLGHALVASRFEAFVLDALLLFQPHNYSEALRRVERRLAPRDVKRARDYIHQNLASPITLADLVDASGVPGRTLLQHFRDAHGVSPMRYVRDLRMQRVRGELASGTARCVADCALRWGFAHPGRFSIEYRRRFGESPSSTLARGRASWPAA